MTPARPFRAARRAATACAALVALATAACAPQTGGGGAPARAAGDDDLRVAAAVEGVAGAPTDFCDRIEFLVNQAHRFNFLTQFASAEAIWARLSADYDSRDPTADCPAAPARSALMANQALVYSNQRKFVAADGMFRAAARQLDRESAAASQEENAARSAVLEVLRTTHSLNRAVTDPRAMAEAERLSDALDKDLEGAFALEAQQANFIQLSHKERRERAIAALEQFSRAYIHLQQGNLRVAEAAIDKALALIAPVPGAESSFVPRFRTTKGIIRLERGDPAGALAQAKAAEAGFSTDLRDTALGARALVVQGAALEQLGRTEEALAAFKDGFGIYQTVAVPISYDLIWPYFRLATRVMRADPSRRATLTRDIFEAAQAVRSRATAASVAAAAVARAEGKGAEGEAIRDWLRARQDLSRISGLRATVEANPLASDGQRAEVRKLHQKAADRVARLTEELRVTAPDYLGLLSAKVDVGALQQALGPDEAFVQLVPGNPRGMSFVVTGDDIRAEIAAADLSADALSQYVEFLRDGMRFGAPYAPNLSHAIYKAYLAPVEDAFSGRRKLVFATGGALSALPMEALAMRPSAIDDAARRTDFTDVSWMADRFEISYVPSADTLTRLRKAPARAPGVVSGVTAFGAFVPGVDPEKVLARSYMPVECMPEAQLVANAPPLTGTRRELDAIRAVFGPRARIVTGAEFTEEKVKADSASGALGGAGILHFATHGFLPQSADCLNQAGLTVTATDAPDSDGMLTEEEIRALDLDADLVVLSACDTASARVRQLEGNIGEGGEALSGLARAFFDAGVRAALVTHWPIEDSDPSILLVETFYRGVAAGRSYGASLNEAQKVVRASPASSDPFYWAAFVLVGEGGA